MRESRSPTRFEMPRTMHSGRPYSEQARATAKPSMSSATASGKRVRRSAACSGESEAAQVVSKRSPGPLAAAEAWVFEPSDENLTRVSTALDHAYVDDDTVNCALAVLYHDGTLGPGDLRQYPAPAGAAETAAFAMNMVALGQLSDKFEEHGRLLVDRALDIAKGGRGLVAAAGE